MNSKADFHHSPLVRVITGLQEEQQPGVDPRKGARGREREGGRQVARGRERGRGGRGPEAGVDKGEA